VGVGSGGCTYHFIVEASDNRLGRHDGAPQGLMT
jgi:hypothetical protein